MNWDIHNQQDNFQRLQRKLSQEKSNVNVDSLVLGTNGSENDQRLLFAKGKNECKTQAINRPSSIKNDFQDSEALPIPIEKQVEIDFCENGQTGKNNKENSYEMHINHQNEKIHMEEKPFADKNCNEKFNQSAVLKSHEKIHAEEKPFACKYCNKKFTWSGDIKRHWWKTLCL